MKSAIGRAAATGGALSLMLLFAADAGAETEKPSKPAPAESGSGKKILWDKLEAPDLPKTTAEPVASAAAAESDTDKDRLKKLEEEIEALKKRVTTLEGKVAIQQTKPPESP